MNLNEYQALAQRTADITGYAPVTACGHRQRPEPFGKWPGAGLDRKAGETAITDLDKKLLNGCMGMCGEAGECIDLLKKHMMQGHELDREKMIKEIGDVLWYVAEAASALGVTLDEVAERNIAKLKARYPDGFSSEKSINRAPENETVEYENVALRNFIEKAQSDIRMLDALQVITEEAERITRSNIIPDDCKRTWDLFETVRIAIDEGVMKNGYRFGASSGFHLAEETHCTG